MTMHDKFLKFLDENGCMEVFLENVDKNEIEVDYTALWSYQYVYTAFHWRESKMPANSKYKDSFSYWQDINEKWLIIVMEEGEDV